VVWCSWWEAAFWIRRFLSRDGLERSFSNSKSEQVGLSPGALRAHFRWSFLVPGYFFPPTFFTWWTEFPTPPEPSPIGRLFPFFFSICIFFFFYFWKKTRFGSVSPPNLGFFHLTEPNRTAPSLRTFVNLLPDLSIQEVLHAFLLHGHSENTPAAIARRFRRTLSVSHWGPWNLERRLPFSSAQSIEWLWEVVKKKEKIEKNFQPKNLFPFFFFFFLPKASLNLFSFSLLSFALSFSFAHSIFFLSLPSPHTRQKVFLELDWLHLGFFFLIFSFLFFSILWSPSSSLVLPQRLTLGATYISIAIYQLRR